MKTGKRIFMSMIAITFALMAGCADLKATETFIGEVKDFELMTPQGESIKLSELLKKHKAVLINFWATWCPPCQEEVPGLIKTQSQYAAEGFTILGVDVGESKSKVISYIGKSGINYPVVLDKNQAVAEGYGIVGIPTSLLVSSDGKILGKYHAYTRELVADIEKAVSKK